MKFEFTDVHFQKQDSLIKRHLSSWVKPALTVLDYTTKTDDDLTVATDLPLAQAAS